MVDLDGPAVKVGLQQGFGRRLLIVAQQVSFLPVIDLSSKKRTGLSVSFGG
jgi:hypothetical protein